MPEWRHRVTKAEAGLRLDRFLEGRLGGLSRSQVKRLVDRGLVQVEGRTAKAGHPLRIGERLRVDLPDPPSLHPMAEDLPLVLVYQDDSILVVDKPAGMAVHPGAGRPGGTLVNALLGHGIELSPLGAPSRPGIVHRLDLQTSGLLVVAKTSAAHAALARALAAREVERRYWTIVWGHPPERQGRIQGALARSRADRRRMRVVAEGGKEAATRYTVRFRGAAWSVLSVSLETGRTHQIRAHFKHAGYPVFGDPDYGGRSSRLAGLAPAVRVMARGALAGLPRQALHAARLALVHPGSGRRLVFTSELPDDIHEAAARLGIPPESRSLGSKEDS